MKTGISACILAILLSIPAISIAAPSPSSYDDPAWFNYLEKGKTAAIPDGLPTGPGAVSAYNGKVFWPDGYIQITAPYDLAQNADLAMAESAKVNNRTFASETMKLFLEAVTANVRKLSKNNDLKVPVQELFFAPGTVPMRVLADETNTIEFGVYILNGSISEPATDVRLHGEIASKGAAFLLTSKTRTSQRYQKYQKLADPFKDRFSTMTTTEFYATTQEILKIANEQLGDFDKSAADKKAAQIVQEKDDADKLNREKEASKLQIMEKYEKELDALRDKLIQDLSRKERDEVVLKIKDVEKQKQAELQALKTNNKTGNDQLSIQERFVEINNNKRLTPAQRNLRNGSASIRHDGDLAIDEATMWNLVESIVTQKVANVAEIRIPDELKKRLVAYAQKAKKNKKTITAFEELAIDSRSTFEVSLSCSTRDRFLGCQLGGSPDIEKRITKAASALLKSAVKLPPKRQLEIIQLVINANPVELEYLFDTTELHKEYDDYFDYNERTKYLRLITALENTPIKGESSATRTRRLKKARNIESDTDFENYFDDYLNEIAVP